MERFDAAIIGAGPEGLIAAHRLASAGLRVVVLERQSVAGGRAVTTEFHPGFRASRFSDELPPIPASIIRRMNLARHGAVFMPLPASICVSPDNATVIYRDAPRMARLAGPSGAALAELHRDLEETRAVIARRANDVSPRPRFALPWSAPRRKEWPGEAWGRASLAEALFSRLADSALGLHVAASVMASSAASPYAPGSALHLLKGLSTSGLARGGLGSLGAALHDAAVGAGAEIRLGCAATDIMTAGGKARGVVLAGGAEIEAKTVISTLDLKNTFLALVSWDELPAKLARRVAQYRMSGASARILFALDAPPTFSFAAEAEEAALGAVHVVESLDAFAHGADRWRSGALAEKLPVTLRVPSLLDPSLAPPGKAVMTATIGGVPAKLFDGPWTSEKRGELIKIVLRAAMRLAPGIETRLLAVKTVIADDIERDLGVTAGDLDGGELTPDQALGFRPFPDWQDARTPIRNLYLGGASSAPAPFFTGASGVLAAEAVLTDLKTGGAK